MNPNTHRQNRRGAIIRLVATTALIAALLPLLPHRTPAAQAQAPGGPPSCAAFIERYFITSWPASSYGPASVGFDLVYTAPNLVSSYARGSLRNATAGGQGNWNGTVVQQFFDDRTYPSGAPFNADKTDRLGVTLFRGSTLVVRLDLLSWGGGSRWITVQGCTGNNVLFGTFDDGGGAVAMSFGFPAAP